jgi:hypothetical protein
MGLKLNIMNDVLNKIELALTNKNSAIELENIVYELKLAGKDRKYIYEQFHDYRKLHLNSDKWHYTEALHNGDHPLDIILDRISAWCSKGKEFDLE